jgi:hypothetical protein
MEQGRCFEHNGETFCPVAYGLSDTELQSSVDSSNSSSLIPYDFGGVLTVWGAEDGDWSWQNLALWCLLVTAFLAVACETLKVRKKFCRARRCCGHRIYRAQSQETTRLQWQNLIGSRVDLLTIWRRDAVVQPRQTEFSQLGQTLNAAKKQLSLDIYNLTYRATGVTRLWSDLGRLLQRHPWAITKRERKNALEDYRRGLPLQARFRIYTWKTPTGTWAESAAQY